MSHKTVLPLPMVSSTPLPAHACSAVPLLGLRRQHVELVLGWLLLGSLDVYASATLSNVRCESVDQLSAACHNATHSRHHLCLIRSAGLTRAVAAPGSLNRASPAPLGRVPPPALSLHPSAGAAVAGSGDGEPVSSRKVGCSNSVARPPAK